MDAETGGGQYLAAGSDSPTGKRGPLTGVIWWSITFVVMAIVFGASDYKALFLIIGYRSMIALAGYLIMQIGLWHAENKWDEEGSQAYLKAAGKNKSDTPETLEAMDMGEVTIPADELKAAFPVPWGFLIGWWVWGLSYLFPLDGTSDVKPTAFGIIALIVCLFVSFVASVPMSDAVMNRIPGKKKALSLMFLLGWIVLGIMSALDVNDQLNGDTQVAYVWLLCLLGPFTVILSQKILFESRKMGTFWEVKGSPNFSPIVYNMGGPLFVWGWFFFWLGICCVPVTQLLPTNIYYDFPTINAYIPLFLNWRTALAFFSGCGMVPVVGFLDYSHDLDGPWMGENEQGKVFGKWWLGTDGTYFGLFLESPWPFVIMWTVYGFSAFLTFDNQLGVQTNGVREALLCLNCILQGVDAGILIQANLYAGNMAGKNKFSKPFVLLFFSLAINIGYSWGWFGLALSLPGAILVILGQKTVFGHRKRGDYTMQNAGKANPYDNVNVYSWGEVFFMIGWISICWAMSLPL